MRYSKTGSLFLLAVMVLATVAPPFAYAEDAAVEEEAVYEEPDTIYVPGCDGTVIHKISDADRERLWDSTIGFTAQEISDLDPQQAAYEETGTFENPMYLTVAPEGAEQTIDFRAFATLMGQTGEEEMVDLALQLGVQIDRDGNVPNDARVLISRANLYAENQGKASVFMNKLAEWGLVEQGATQLPASDAPAYSDFKVRLPETGEDVALSDLFKLNELDVDSCMLSDTLNGRVTYLGSLNDDIAYGNANEQVVSGEYENPATGSVDDELVSTMNQHFTASSMQGYLELNGGGNMLIPSFYEDWLSYVKNVNRIQFYGSLIIGVSSTAASRALASKLETLDSFNDRAVKQMSSLSKQEKASPEMVTSLENKMAMYDSDITKYTEIASSLDPIKQSMSGHLGASIAFGLGWLGPGRFVFSINDGLLLRTSDLSASQYVKVYAGREVAQKYRSATDTWGLGDISETLSSLTGLPVPAKAFQSGPILLLNKPLSDNERGDQETSITSIRSNRGDWAISTRWSGLSHTTNFEDLRVLGKDEDHTSLALVTNEILPEAVINTATNGKAYQYVSILAMPLIMSRGVLSNVGRIFGVGAALSALQVATTDLNENFDDIACDKEVLDSMKSWYSWGSASIAVLELSLTSLSTIASYKVLTQGTDAAPFYLFAKHIFPSASTIMSWTSPLEVYQLYWGNRAMEYVSSCKDSQYKILTYQALTEQTETDSSQLNELLQPITESISRMTAGEAAMESYSPVTGAALDNLRTILNFKTVMEDQYGAVSPSELLYVQVEESAWSVQGGLFDQLAGESSCNFNENYANGELNFNLGEDGITVYNDDGSVRLSLNDYWNKVRALGRMRSQENARVILPNKIIEHSLNCQGEFLEVDYRANAVLKDNCAADCLLNAISLVTYRDASSDLSDAIGTISSVDTDKGVASFAGDAIRFLVLYPDEEEEQFGEEVTAPGADQLGLASRQELQASKITVSIDENGVVTAELSGSGQPKRDIGSVKTIIGDRGKIEFSNGKMLLFVYSLAGTSAQNIRDLTSSLEEGEMNLGVVAKTGAEESGEELNAALDAIQGEGGMDVLETDDHIYYFDGENLRVIDKNTGEATDYTITGREDLGNGRFAYDTDAGQFVFGFDMENGQPMLSAQGPDGLNEVLALLAANGDDGILTFNPSTGAINVYNGQDVPLSPEFSSKGISFIGDESGGTRGIAANNPFATSWDTTGTTASKGLNLPAWPEDQLIVALMICVVLLGAAFVRRD